MGGKDTQVNQTGRGGGGGRYEDILEMKIKVWGLFGEKPFCGGLVLSEEIFLVGLVGYVLEPQLPSATRQATSLTNFRRLLIK